MDLCQDRPLYNKFKRYWKLILKQPNHLIRTEYKKSRLFSEWKSTYGIVQYLLNVDETLAANYHYAHVLSDALRQDRMHRFKELIETSSSVPLSPGMRTVLRTFKKYYPHIEHTLHHPKLNNWPLEGINNSIKTLKRVTFGYRNFAHFRDRILLMTRLYQPKPKAPNSLIAS